MLRARRMLIETAHPEDLAQIVALLRAAQLPSDDLAATMLGHFLVLRESDSRSVGGVIGLEPHAQAALLRSLAIAPAQRGGGQGGALVKALEVKARTSGIRDLFLLTTTAEKFFARLGYAVVPREAAPKTLQSTTEFTALCPASAICMHKAI